MESHLPSEKSRLSSLAQGSDPQGSQHLIINMNCLGHELSPVTKTCVVLFSFGLSFLLSNLVKTCLWDQMS